MKKISGFLITLAIAAFSVTAASASNYPPGYMNQSAVAVSLSPGPVVLAEVNTMLSGYKYVIGYTPKGILAGKADHVNAYVKVHYKLIPLNGGNANSMTAERQIKLKPEWNGIGYISGELSQYTNYGTDGLIFLPSQALTYNTLEIEKIELAFNVNGQWDSNYGLNYVIYTETLRRLGTKFKSGYTSSAIAVDTWSFIVTKMRE